MMLMSSILFTFLVSSTLIASSDASAPFDIESFGAIAGIDTRSIALTNGLAFASAIAAANASLTSREVLVRSGRNYSYLPSVSDISGLTNVTLLIEGTLNLYTANFSDTKAPFPGWPSVYPGMGFSSCSNFAIISTTGKGVFNGRGNLWWWYTIFFGDHRNNLLNVYQCTNFTLSGVTFLNSPQWHMFLQDIQQANIFNVTVLVDIEDQLDALRYIGGGTARLNNISTSEDIAQVLRAAHLVGPADEIQLSTLMSRAPLDDVSNENLQTSRRAALTSTVMSESWFKPQWAITPPVPMVWALNTDGIDFTGSNIRVTNCRVTNFDDSVCVKPSGGTAATGGCTHDIYISDINVTYGVGVSMGSVPPHDDGNCIDNVIARRLTFDTPLKALYIKPNPSNDPNAFGAITNIVYEDIVIKNSLWWPIYVGLQQQDQPGSGGGTGCSFIFPLFNSTCPSDPRVTVANITYRNIDIYGGICAPGLLMANETNPGTGFIFDAVIGHNVSTWPFVGYYVNNVHGTTSGGTNPVPQGFVPTLLSPQDKDKKKHSR